MPSGIIISAALKRMSAGGSKLLYDFEDGWATCIRAIFHYSQLQVSQSKDIASFDWDKADRAIGDLHKWFLLLRHGVGAVSYIPDFRLMIVRC